MSDLIATSDGARAEAIADSSQGAPTLFNGVKRGVRRVVQGGRLFDGGDLVRLADSFASHTATAEVAGRARIRERAQRHMSFNELPAMPRSIVPPAKAVEWFRRIAPASRINPAVFEAEHQGRAFQLAATTEAKLLEKIHDAIAKRVADGDPVNDGAKAVRDILSRAGVNTPDTYCRMVYRTNVMEAYRHGSWDEYRDPDLDDWFPVWQYVGIADGRERQKHHELFGRYFPRNVDFFDVRGKAAGDVINCRCDLLPIDRLTWRRLERQGARLATR